MELPSAESIGKFFGGVIITIVGGWAALKRFGFLEKSEEKTVEETPKLRRAEDTGLKIATEYLEKKIDDLELKFERRLKDEKAFLMDQIESCENRITDQVQEVGRRLDAHYQGVNERLDILIRGIK